MKKSEKQEQNQGEVEDEGADRKYQVFNFFGTKLSGLQNWFWCLQRYFSITFDAPVIHVPGYILLQFTFLCFIFVNLASPSEGESL